nr:MAG TPA: portal protein [Caudoviricetes sp.]
MSIIDRVTNLFKPQNNVTAESQSVQVDDVLLQALLNGETITRDKAMNIPAVAGAVDFIAGTIASMPIKLYKYKQGVVTEVESDTRVKLLNGDTGDTLDGFQLKKAMVEDYLLGKGGYAVIQRRLNEVTGLFYVKDIDVTPLKNADPVYKYVNFNIGARTYKNYEVLKLLRNTKDGATGKGVVNEVSKALETAYNTLLYQLGLVKTGGNKKGFLKSQRKLGTDEIKALKDAWRNMYANNTESVVVLNNGLEFQESSNSSVEMQLNESKLTLKSEIDNIFHIRADYYQTFKECLYPIIKAFETSLNSTLLLENEKKWLYFAFDVKEILKASIKERYEAHAISLEKGWTTINEVRRAEDMNYIEGLDVINVGLGAVLYNTETHEYYTPNTNSTKADGGETDPVEPIEPVEEPTQGEEDT